MFGDAAAVVTYYYSYYAINTIPTRCSDWRGRRVKIITGHPVRENEKKNPSVRPLNGRFFILIHYLHHNVHSAYSPVFNFDTGNPIYRRIWNSTGPKPYSCGSGRRDIIVFTTVPLSVTLETETNSLHLLWLCGDCARVSHEKCLIRVIRIIYDYYCNNARPEFNTNIWYNIIVR